MKKLLFFILMFYPVYSFSQIGVKNFELNRYLGKWYEIARMPAGFEKDLTHVTAEYSLHKKGYVVVLNSGKKYGKLKVAKGKAKFAKEPTTGHLKVSFFGPFYGDYIIVDIDPDYQYVLVISSKKYAWILSRKPELDKNIIDRYINKMK